MATESVQPDDTTQAAPVHRGPHMWPAVIIIAAVLAAFAYSLQAASLMQNALGFFIVPMLGLLLLAIWWLVSRGVPLRDRIMGLVLFLAAIGAIVVQQGPNGYYILSRALPIMLTGVVLVLLLTARMPWNARRAAGLMTVIACVGLFSAIRLDSIAGDLSPNLSWRWDPPNTAEWGDEIVNPGKTAALPETVGPGDWPAFRGPNRDSHAIGVTFNTDWDANPPELVWRQPIGLGFSSFAVVGDYLFTQEQRDEYELVVCYDGRSGEEIWINKIKARFQEGTGDGPRATPTFLDARLYAQGATGTLQCLDAATGDVIWKRDLKKDTGADVPQWGFASSPLIVDGELIVFAGGPENKGVAAYDTEDGSLVWCGGKGVHGYSSAHLATLAGTEQVLITSDVGVQSFDPESFDLLWEHMWDIRMNPRCVQPVIPDDDAILIGTAGGLGTRRVNIAKTGEGWTAEAEWTTKRYKPYFNDSIYFDGHCYGYDGNRLTCIDTATGETVWSGDRCGGQILFLPDMKKLLVLSEAGEVLLLDATPDEATVVAQFQAITGKTWNHPVIADGKLFVRNAAEMACFDLP